jgi:hypothetical protein
LHVANVHGTLLDGRSMISRTGYVLEVLGEVLT